jgi:hypothetical protein
VTPSLGATPATSTVPMPRNATTKPKSAGGAHPRSACMRRWCARRHTGRQRSTRGCGHPHPSTRGQTAVSGDRVTPPRSRAPVARERSCSGR